MLWLYLITTSVILWGGQASSGVKTRYILYDVNPGEGFNLRRDVYMRMAVFVRKLNLAKDGTKWVLVLPPWGHLYHWRSRKLGAQTKIPWAKFFDLKSLGRYVHVIEFTKWVKVVGGMVDKVFYLQGYKEGWKDGKFEEKYDVRECLEPARYQQQFEGGVYEGEFFHFSNVFARSFDCLSVQGHTSVLTGLLKDQEGLSIMLDRAENLLHDWHGDADYWAARRSMRFSKKLSSRAALFRAEELDSEDSKDDTEVAADWRKQRAERKLRGGDYGCVHLRRGDFARSRKEVPSVTWAAQQLKNRMEEWKLTKLFVSTDASVKEMAELYKTMGEDIDIVTFSPEPKELQEYQDGGVAIIDQIICSHAKYFIGTRESTFTLRIQEEREIMGFRTEDTFDMLCSEGELDCEPGTKWTIDWGEGRDWSLPVAGKDRSEL